MNNNIRLLIATFVVALGPALCADAQIAKWVLAPTYDSMELLPNGLLKVKKGGKTGLLSADGTNVLLPLEHDSITPFVEDKALILNGGNFTDIVTINGDMAHIKSMGYRLVPGAESFSHNYLLVKERDHYYYLDEGGNKAYGPYASAQPFINGHAVVEGYENLAKNTTDTYFTYLRPGEGEMTFTNFNVKDINFASSFNDGQAVVVVKKKFYLLGDDVYTLDPIASDPANKKKTQLQSDDKVVTLGREGDNFTLAAKTGRLLFDPVLRLKEINITGSVPVTFDFTHPAPVVHNSAFSVTSGEDNLKGLNYNGNPLLPPQFDEVAGVKDRLALVKSDGLYGIITVDPRNSIEVSVNNNEPVGFMHQYHTTNVVVTVPPFVSLNNATLSSLDKDCEIRRETRAANNYVECNTLGYECRLHIPDNLTASLTDHTYNYVLNYDGLVSVPQSVNVPQWFIKLYDIELPSEAISFAATDSVTIEFTLSKSSVAGDDTSNYFKDVTLFSPSLGAIPIVHNNENQYAFRIGNTDVDRLQFILNVTEAGCPTMQYPFEMNFDRTTGKKGNTSVTFTSFASSVTSNGAESTPPAAAPAVNTSDMPAAPDTPSVP